MGNNIVVTVCQSQKNPTHENVGKLNHYKGILNQAFVPGLVYLILSACQVFNLILPYLHISNTITLSTTYLFHSTDD